jgi:hypothetical protein
MDGSIRLTRDQNRPIGLNLVDDDDDDNLIPSNNANVEKQYYGVVQNCLLGFPDDGGSTHL